MNGVPERMPAAPAEGWANSHKGLAMDRRLPEWTAWSSHAPVATGVMLWLAHAAAAMDSESQTIPIASAGGFEAGGSMLVPLAVTALAAGVAAWFWGRRRARAQARPEGCIQVLDRAATGRGRALSLVRVGDRVVLVGESAQGFQRLAEFDAHEQAEPSAGTRRLAS